MGQLPYRSDVHARAVAAREPYDWAFCRTLAEEHRVVAVPASPFFCSADYQGGPLARFAFCKQDSTLLEAATRLQARRLVDLRI